MVLICLLQSLVSLFGRESLIRQDYLAFSIVYFQHLCLQHIIYMNSVMQIQALIIRVFALCNNTVCFVPYIQDDLIIFYIDYCTFDYLSVMNCFE